MQRVSAPNRCLVQGLTCMLYFLGQQLPYFKEILNWFVLELCKELFIILENLITDPNTVQSFLEFHTDGIRLHVTQHNVYECHSCSG